MTALALATLALPTLALGGCSVVNDALGDGEAGVFTLVVGDCLNDADETGDVSTVPIVPCEGPHDSEVYASVMMDDPEYPGEEATIAAADAACRLKFADFVGIPVDDSIYSYATLYPTSDSWSGGDREILCRIALLSDDGRVTPVSGSLAGSAR